jgi:hypothetical protein
VPGLDPEVSAQRVVSDQSLRMYPAQMSWPARASLGRARSVENAIDGFFYPCDPPFLGQIAADCRKFREVEPRGHLLRITPPTELQARHRALAQAYAELRGACRGARLAALRLRAAIDSFYRTRSAANKAALRRSDTRARRLFVQLGRTGIPTFVQAVRSWRVAALGYAAARGVPAPTWLRELPVGP